MCTCQIYSIFVDFRNNHLISTFNFGVTRVVVGKSIKVSCEFFQIAFFLNLDTSCVNRNSSPTPITDTNKRYSVVNDCDCNNPNCNCDTNVVKNLKSNGSDQQHKQPTKKVWQYSEIIVLVTSLLDRFSIVLTARNIESDVNYFSRLLLPATQTGWKHYT